jgi:predicted DCC family thiol-disulfide oxidoreductase YuxK
MLRRLLRPLDEYWFREGSLRLLALFRMLVAGAHLFFFYPVFQRQLDRLAAPASEFIPIPALKVLLLPLGEWGIRPDPTLVEAIWLIGIVAGIGALLGKYTRASLFVFALAHTFLTAHDYSYGFGHHPDALTVITMWALVLSPCGERWSLDDLQFRLRGARVTGRFAPLTPADDRSTFALWPLLLAQWLLALAYLSAGASKLSSGGLAWFDSSTLAFYLVQDGVRWDQPLGIYLAGFPWLMTFLAVVTVVFEATFFMAIVVPRLAWIYLLVGIGIHVGILFTMAAPFIPWLILYTAFLPTLLTTFPGTWILARIPEPRRWWIVFDGRCPLCIRSMVLLDYVDVRRNLGFLDLEEDWEKVEAIAPALTRERALHLMHVVGPDGRVLGGFAAFRELTRALPLLWILYPFLRLPFADRVGEKVYAAIASRRGRSPCGAAGCRVREEPFVGTREPAIGAAGARG